jgi:diguanylate cyclase (GGDEF)-like protein
VGTSGGLDLFDPVRKRFIHEQENPHLSGGLASRRIQSLSQDQNRNIWIGTRNGLNRIEAGTKNLAVYRSDPDNSGSLADNFIRVILVDKNGSVWIGTDVGGLHRYQPDSDSFLRIDYGTDDAAALSSNRITTIAQDRKGFLWVGTLNGLNRLDPRTMFIKKYYQDDGLLSDTVYGILCDDDDFVWISSNRGLSRLDPDSGEIRNYGPNVGLQSSIFKRGSCFRDRAGNLFFGGLNGVNEFNPSTIVDNARQPPIVLTSLEINNETVEDLHLFAQTDGLDLPYNENNLFFEFAALDFTNPNQNRFAYYLDGFDDGWHKAGTRRSASYTNLEPGRYVFSVRATNSDGIWNESGISLVIRISPPYWATNWFRFLAGLAVFSLLLGLHFTRVSANKKKERELQELVNDRTALLEQANFQLKKLADSDGLTGIANHRRFHELLFEEWRRSVRTRTPVSLAMVDIDFFKLYNDSLGHQAGDECLRQVAQRLSSIPGRAGDLVARYGGEEFAVLLSSTDAAGGERISEELREAIESMKIPHPASPISAFVTCSVGLGTAYPSSELFPSELVRWADVALYRAKQSGRNGVVALEIPRDADNSPPSLHSRID